MRAATSCAQRVLRCERGELGDQVRPTAEAQLCTDPVFYRCQPELVEPRDGRLEELLGEDVQQCWSPPESESVSQRLRGGSRIVGQLGTSGGYKSLEPHDVDIVRPDHESIARWM